MEEVLALLVPFAGMALAFGIVYINRTASNREKMSMLDKGFTPQEIAETLKDKNDPQKNLSTGLLFIGAASGVLLGFFISQHYPIKPVLAYVSCAFLLGGVGLLIAYFIQEGKNKA